mgnify:CR=1 FL=1
MRIPRAFRGRDVRNQKLYRRRHRYTLSHNATRHPRIRRVTADDADCRRLEIWGDCRHEKAGAEAGLMLCGLVTDNFAIAIGFGIGIDYSLVKWPSLTSTLFKSAKIGVICGSGLLFVSVCLFAGLLFALQQKAAILLLQQNRGLILFNGYHS